MAAAMVRSVPSPGTRETMRVAAKMLSPLRSAGISIVFGTTTV
jgi:hypothetical protein